jgi:membrane-bound lytic murein transglycosylase F
VIRFLIFLIAFSLAGCGLKKKKARVEQAPFCRDLDEIIASGKLVALTDVSSTSYFVYQGAAVGFEYDLLKRFAKELGVQLEIKAVEDLDCIVDMLEQGEGDLIAANYTVTPERQELINFSQPILQTHQVLVQRLPTGWYSMPKASIDTMLVKSIENLVGKTVYVRYESSYYPLLAEANIPLNHQINIETVSKLTTEQLIEQVAKGEIEYTVADENIARLNKAYFPNIDINTKLSEEQDVAWAARQSSHELLDSLNTWLTEFKASKSFAMIHMKYFQARTQHKKRVMSKFSSLKGGGISAYDDILRRESKRIGWDWKLLAAMIKKESNFNPNAQAASGASGLMQLIPNTAAHFGADSVLDPEQNIQAGVSYIAAVMEHWEESIADSAMRIRFVLASYNVGLGHVQDAQRLAIKYGQDANQWPIIAHYLEMLMQPEFYNDEVVKYGYCRGTDPVHYVLAVETYWTHYRNTFGGT